MSIIPFDFTMRTRPLFFFITLFATIGVYIVHLVMAVINSSFPLLLHEPLALWFSSQAADRNYCELCQKSVDLSFPPFSQSKYVM